MEKYMKRETKTTFFLGAEVLSTASCSRLRDVLREFPAVCPTCIAMSSAVKILGLEKHALCSETQLRQALPKSTLAVARRRNRTFLA